MRVAFIDQTGDVIGGAQESLALLLTHLPADIEPVVILFNDGPFAERLRAANLPVEIVSISDAIAVSTRDKISLRGLSVLPRAVLSLARLLRRRHIDVVHTNTVKAHFIGAPAAFLARLPCVAHLRDILPGKSGTALRYVLRAFTSDQVSISRTVARCYGLRNATVVANPIDLSKYVTMPDREAARVLLGLPATDRVVFAIVGRINRWKGHDRFLRAAAIASATTPDLHFAIVGEPRFGDDDFANELERLSVALEIEDRVSFLPWQSDLPTLYAATDVIVNCSTQEPFGRTIIEAGAAQVPAICFDDAGVAEFMKDEHLEAVVPADDDHALAAAIARFGRNHTERRAAGHAAKRWSKIFDADAHAARLTFVLHRAGARSTASRTTGQ